MGLTYINETADRLKDELWHIAVADRVPLYDPALTQFVCERCKIKLASRADLENHQIEEHSFKPPRLYLLDQIQPYLLSFKNLDQVKKLQVENVETIQFLNGARWINARLEEIKNSEFWSTRQRLEVKLIGRNQEVTRHLFRLDDVNENQIQAASEQFKNRFANEGDFSWDEVIEFESLDTGKRNCRYRKALANYLRGVLFRNKNFEAAGAKRESFREVYNAAYSELRYHDDQLSRVIVAIINLSKSDFTVRRPTGVQQLDFLATLFFEITEFGESNIKLPKSCNVGLPIVPTDKSSEALLKLVGVHESEVFETLLKRSSCDGDILRNELNLAKILYLWMFSRQKPSSYAAVKSDFVHNTRFSKFIRSRSRDD